MATITATVNTSFWPYRVSVSVTGLTVSDEVQIWRAVAGVRTNIRGGVFTATATTIDLLDAEQPFGVELTYGLTIDQDDDDTADPITVTLTDTKVVLTDAIQGLAVPVGVMSHEPEHDGQSTVFRVGGRNVVVSNDWGQWSGPLVLKTRTQAQNSGLDSLCRNATGRVVQIRQDGTIPDLDAYAAILRARPLRLTPAPGDHRRVWEIDAAQVDAWPAGYPTSAT